MVFTPATASRILYARSREVLSPTSAPEDDGLSLL